MVWSGKLEKQLAMSPQGVWKYGPDETGSPYCGGWRGQLHPLRPLWGQLRNVLSQHHPTHFPSADLGSSLRLTFSHIPFSLTRTLHVQVVEIYITNYMCPSSFSEILCISWKHDSGIVNLEKSQAYRKVTNRMQRIFFFPLNHLLTWNPIAFLILICVFPSSRESCINILQSQCQEINTETSPPSNHHSPLMFCQLSQ